MANLKDTIIQGVLNVNGVIVGTANLTGVSTAVTANSGTSTDQIATTKFVMKALEQNKGIAFNIVDVRPDVGEDGIIYLVPNGKSEGDNQYDKYFYLEGRWEELGNGIEVVDNLVSTDSQAVLSANQGRILNEHKVGSSDRSIKDIVTLTSEEYKTLKENGQLVEGTIYNITDDIYTGTDNTDILKVDYKQYSNSFRDTQDITSLISSKTFNNIYNDKYNNIMFYESNISSGKISVNRYYAITVSTGQHYTYDNINTINLQLSNSNYVNLSMDTTTNIVYKGQNGPNSGGGGQACFTKNTLINTQDGLKFIKDIKIGEKILSYNFKTNKTEYKEVNNIYTHKSSIIYKFEFEDDVIQTTYDEPFYTENTRVQAQFLSKGDKLFSNKGVQEIQNVTVLRDRDELVYDLSVKDNYNYFVSKNNILVFTEDITKKEG